MVAYETVFAVPVGPEGFAYSLGGPDRPPTGPNAFHLAPDGTVSWDYVDGYTTLRSNTLQGYWPT